MLKNMMAATCHPSMTGNIVHIVPWDVWYPNRWNFVIIYYSRNVIS